MVQDSGIHLIPLPTSFITPVSYYLDLFTYFRNSCIFIQQRVELHQIEGKDAFSFIIESYRDFFEIPRFNNSYEHLIIEKIDLLRHSNSDGEKLQKFKNELENITKGLPPSEFQYEGFKEDVLQYITNQRKKILLEVITVLDKKEEITHLPELKKSEHLQNLIKSTITHITCLQRLKDWQHEKHHSLSFTLRKIDWEQLEFHPNPKDQIGKGGYGIVYAGKYQRKDVAIKLFQDISFSDLNHEVFYGIVREALILQSLNHTNIIHFYAANFQKGLIILEKASCSLFDVLNVRFHANEGIHLIQYDPSRENGEFDEKVIQESILQKVYYPLEWSYVILQDIAKALRYLHAFNIVHRDLKPGNILLFPLPSHNAYPNIQFYQAKITDFGFSKTLDNALIDIDDLNRQENRLGTAGYIAPEIYNHSPPLYSSATDVFAFGLIATELMNEVPNWKDYKNAHDIRDAIVNQRKRPLKYIWEKRIQTNFDHSVFDLIGNADNGCLAQEREKRCSIEAVCDLLQSFKTFQRHPSMKDEPIIRHRHHHHHHLHRRQHHNSDAALETCPINFPPMESIDEETKEPDNSSMIDESHTIGGKETVNNNQDENVKSLLPLEELNHFLDKIDWNGLEQTNEFESSIRETMENCTTPGGSVSSRSSVAGSVIASGSAYGGEETVQTMLTETLKDWFIMATPDIPKEKHETYVNLFLNWNIYKENDIYEYLGDKKLEWYLNPKYSFNEFDAEDIITAVRKKEIINKSAKRDWLFHRKLQGKELFQHFFFPDNNKILPIVLPPSQMTVQQLSQQYQQTSQPIAQPQSPTTSLPVQPTPPTASLIPPEIMEEYIQQFISHDIVTLERLHRVINTKYSFIKTIIPNDDHLRSIQQLIMKKLYFENYLYFNTFYQQSSSLEESTLQFANNIEKIFHSIRSSPQESFKTVIWDYYLYANPNQARYDPSIFQIKDPKTGWTAFHYALYYRDSEFIENIQSEFPYFVQFPLPEIKNSIKDKNNRKEQEGDQDLMRTTQTVCMAGELISLCWLNIFQACKEETNHSCLIRGTLCCCCPVLCPILLGTLLVERYSSACCCCCAPVLIYEEINRGSPPSASPAESQSTNASSRQQSPSLANKENKDSNSNHPRPIHRSCCLGSVEMLCGFYTFICLPALLCTECCFYGLSYHDDRAKSFYEHCCWDPMMIYCFDCRRCIVFAHSSPNDMNYSRLRWG